MITPTKLIGGLDTFINPTKRGAERRIGDWRLVYIIDDAARVVNITRIAHRREVYD
jgi:mRNA-degrading endonuclease RelE of RelBE toxin-antitoxin system